MAAQATLTVLPAGAAPQPDPAVPVPAMVGSVTEVAVAELRPADSPRLAGLDTEHTRALAELGADLPPILVNRSTMRVVDGMHRLAAAELAGREQISVQFCDGTDEEAFVLAVTVNAGCGLPLTLADRRAAAARILRTYPRLSDRSIAAIVGLAPNTVGAMRRRATEHSAHPNTRLGRDGRVRPIDGARGRRAASAVIASQPEASLREIARQAGVSVGTARDVRERVRNGQDPTLTPRPIRRSGLHDGQPRPAARPESAALRPAPAAGSRPHATTPDPPAAAWPAPVADPRSVLEGLRSDPSLRYRESGRSLLQWLGTRTVAAGEWRELLDDVPPHCTILIRRIAYACAAAWTELAEELDRRVDEAT